MRKLYGNGTLRPRRRGATAMDRRRRAPERKEPEMKETIFVSNPDAEQAVLSACMIEGAPYVKRALEVLEPKDFTLVRNRITFEAMADLASEGRAVDPVTVAHRISAERNLAQAGGREAIIDLYAQTFSVAGFEQHLEIVRQAADQRKILEAALVIANDAQVPHVDHAEYLTDVRARAEQILAVCNAHKGR